MLKAIEFVSQANGLVGKEIAKRSVNQNSFMNNVISLGRNQEFLDSLSEKCGELILPVIEYGAVGGVYHQLKVFFAKCMEDGIVGSELPQEKREKAPRAPRGESTTRANARELPITAKIREFESKYHAEIQKLPTIKPDAAAMAVAATFRESGNTALAEQIEAAALAAAQQAESKLQKLEKELLSDCMGVLFDTFGVEKFNAYFQPKPKKKD